MEVFLRRQEELSAQLAKSNINILSCYDDAIYYEYQFRMRNGQTKWAKTVYIRIKDEGVMEGIANILDMVRNIRIEAENGQQ